MPIPSEIELHKQWEQCQDRTLRGREGKYRVINPGKRNGGPGPDYLGAILAFPNGSVHRGDVEIHRDRRDWFQHKHRWDARYQDVILHVIARGSLDSVPSASMEAIPTAYLAKEAGTPSALCRELPVSLRASSEIEGFIQLMAQQRWWRRLGEFYAIQKPALLEILARRLGPEGRKYDIMNIWLNSTAAISDMYPFLSQVHEQIHTKGGSRAIETFQGRIIFTSAIAFMLLRDMLETRNQSLEGLMHLADEIEDTGFPAPTKSFIIEVTGNWLLPLCQARGDRDRFEEWYQLPLGWKYGRVSKHAHKVGIDRPVNFGQQQGMLEWMESLCQPLECDYCPVAGVLGDS